MDAIASFAEGFIGVFQNGADFFVALVQGVLPLVIVLLTAVNALVKLIGEERVNRFAEFAGQPGIQYAPLRFLVLPVVAVFMLTNPACYTAGAFLDERNKAAFYDSAVSFVHPITGLFPHANAAELFVYLGIAEGIEQLGYGLGPLAARYFMVGLVVIFIRGLITQGVYDFLMAREDDELAGAEAAAAGGV